MKKQSYSRKILNKLSLRSIIVMPIILIFFMGSFLGFLQVTYLITDYTEGVIASNQTSIRDHIYDHLDSYFEMPEIVNVNNAILATNGLLNLEDTEALGDVFLQQVKHTPVVSFAYYANTEGGIVSSGLHEGKSRISYTENMEQGDFQIFEVNEEKQQKELVKKIENFDPRTRSWFTEATEETIYWTKVYSGAQEGVLGISTSYPLMTADGKKLGVFGTDVMLDELSAFIKTIKTTENCVVSIIDEDGFIVASSVEEKPFVEKNGVQSRLLAGESKNSVIREGYKNKPQDDLQTQEEVRKNMTIEDREYYYSLTKYARNKNLNWYLMIAIPREDFTSDLDPIFLKFNFLFVMMLIFIFIVYIRISKWILIPITSLNIQAKAITNDNWGIQIETSRTDELGQLTQSFNVMSTKISEYLNMLTKQQNELEELNGSLEEIVETRTKELELLSITDDLTKIYNKRYLVDTLTSSIEVYNEHGITFSIIIFDIDHFKRINDTYGHIEGDRTLADVASFLRSKTRGTDVLGRYGGEEFMIIMGNTQLDDAVKAADRFREELNNTPVGSQKSYITVSGGVAEYNKGETFEETIKRADKKLYMAKDAGRNRIIK